MAFNDDQEEDAIRNTIDYLESEAFKLGEVNSNLLVECGRDMSLLSTLKHNERSLKEQYKVLHSNILATRLQRQRESERLSYLARKQKALEKKKKTVAEMHGRRLFPKSTYEENVHLIGKMNSTRFREHRNIIRTLKEDIQYSRRQKYLEAKQDKAEMVKEIFIQEQRELEENRKRHLQVLYQEKISQISKEANAHLRVKKMLNRIASEKEEKEKVTEELEKKVERLEGIKDQEKSHLQEQKSKTCAMFGIHRTTTTAVLFRPQDNHAASRNNRSMDTSTNMNKTSSNRGILMTSIEESTNNTFTHSNSRGRKNWRNEESHDEVDPGTRIPDVHTNDIGLYDRNMRSHDDVVDENSSSVYNHHINSHSAVHHEADAAIGRSDEGASGLPAINKEKKVVIQLTRIDERDSKSNSEDYRNSDIKGVRGVLKGKRDEGYFARSLDKKNR